MDVDTIYEPFELKLPEPIPSHQVRPKGRRYFVRDEVDAWMRFRCTSPTPGQVA